MKPNTSLHLSHLEGKRTFTLLSTDTNAQHNIQTSLHFRIRSIPSFLLLALTGGLQRRPEEAAARLHYPLTPRYADSKQHQTPEMKAAKVEPRQTSERALHIPISPIDRRAIGSLAKHPADKSGGLK